MKKMSQKERDARGERNGHADRARALTALKNSLKDRAHINRKR